MGRKLFALWMLCPLLLAAVPDLADAQSRRNKSSISVRHWTSDMELFEEKVMVPMRREFAQEQGCEKGRIGHYFDFYQAQLDSIREDLKPLTFMLLREVMLANGRELGPLHDNLPCPGVVTRWALLESFIRSKLGLIGNSLSLLELSGAI